MGAREWAFQRVGDTGARMPMVLFYVNPLRCPVWVVGSLYIVQLAWKEGNDGNGAR